MLTAVKRVGWIIVMLWMATGNIAAQQYIHIQTEDGRPFTINLEGEIYTSSEKGYLIIPQVAPGSHNLLLNFPGNDGPDYSFHCQVGDAPLGYSLKQAIDNSWSIFDLVSFTVERGERTENQALVKAPPPAVQEPPLVTEKPAESKQMLQGQIRKIFDKTGTEGIDQVYIVTNGSKTDTVAIFIPQLELTKPKELAQLQMQSSGREIASLMLAMIGNRKYLAGLISTSRNAPLFY